MSKTTKKEHIEIYKVKPSFKIESSEIEVEYIDEVNDLLTKN